MSQGAKYENKQAEQLMQDPEIEETLVRFQHDLDRLTKKIWEEEFLQ